MHHPFNGKSYHLRNEQILSKFSILNYYVQIKTEHITFSMSINCRLISDLSEMLTNI